MQIQPFERDSKRSNAISNHSKGIGSVRIQIRKGFEAFECKFEQFERDTKDSNVIRSVRMQIRTIRKIFEVVECKFNHSKGIRSVQMQFLTIRKGLEGFEFKFEPFERDSKHLNANSNNLKGIRSIRM